MGLLPPPADLPSSPREMPHWLHSSRYWGWFPWHEASSSPLPSCLPPGGGSTLLYSPLTQDESSQSGQGVPPVLQLPHCDEGRSWEGRGGNYEDSSVQKIQNKKRHIQVLDPSHILQSSVSTGTEPGIANGWSPTTGTTHQNTTGATITARNW